jgi:Na+-translocating ferredoxin:NAD+ oxidoreductase RnfG subunit
MISKLFKNGAYLLLLFGLAMTANSVRAEHFLSMAEAQKLCFTNATRFEPIDVGLTREDIKAIEAATRVKVKNPAPKVWRAWRNADLIGTLWFDQVTGKHELIDYVVALSPPGAVNHVEIVEYREHYGGEVRRRSWLDQFKGKGRDAPLKPGSDIYNISGATISCQHVTEGIKRVLATFDRVRDRVVDASADRVPNRP